MSGHVVSYTHARGGVLLTTTSTLCPKTTCNRVHVHHWVAPATRGAASWWTEDPTEATVYPTETAAADAFADLSRDAHRYEVPLPQLTLDITQEPPAELAEPVEPAEPFTWTCGEPIGKGRWCNTVTQGGRAGLAQHRATVHPDRSTP